MKQLLLLSLTVSLFLSACGNTDTADDAAQEAAAHNTLAIPAAQFEEYGIDTAPVLEERVQRTISLPARVEVDPDHMAQVVSLIDGRIKSVRVREGNRVSAGSVLATIESVELGTLVSDLIRFNSDQKTGKASWERLKRLYAENVGSEKNLQMAENEYVTAKAGFQSARQRLLAAGMSPEDISGLLADPDGSDPLLRLRAPIGGTVTLRNASVGSQVGMDDVLFEIVDMRSLLVEGNAYEEHFSELREGLRATFHTPVLPDSAVPGIVTYVASTLDRESNSLPVRMRLQSASTALRPNLNGRLDIVSDGERRVLSVPAHAIVFDGSERFVFVRTGEGTFEYRRVETGQDFGERIEIVSGVTVDDSVVSEGVFNLKSRLKLSQMEEE